MNLGSKLNIIYSITFGIHQAKFLGIQ